MHGDWITLYYWFSGLSFPFKHIGCLSLSIHIDLLSSFKNSFTVFHHTTYQTYHNILNQSPTHGHSCFQLFAVARSAMMNISAYRTALFLKEVPWTTVLSYYGFYWVLETQLGAVLQAMPDSGWIIWTVLLRNVSENLDSTECLPWPASRLSFWAMEAPLNHFL